MAHVWATIEPFGYSCWGACSFFLLALGEFLKENDWPAAGISVVLGILLMCVSKSAHSVFTSFRERCNGEVRRRTFCLWTFLTAWTFFLSYMGHNAMLSTTAVAMHEVETNFHLFMLVFVLSYYLSIAHDSNFALPYCAAKSIQVITTYMLVPTIAVGIPLAQAKLRSAKLESSSVWQLCLLTEYSAVFSMAILFHTYRGTQSQATLVADA